MKIFMSALAASFFFAGAFVACGSDDPTPVVQSGKDAGIDAATATSGASLAQAVCDRFAECSVFINVTYIDAAACVAAQQKDLDRGLALGKNTLSQADIESCAAKLRSASCKDLLGNNIFGQCKKAGTLADNAPCGAATQCVSGVCKRADDTATCGTCAAPGAAGGSCTENGECTDGLVCNKDHKCAAPAKVNEACGKTDCEYGLACFNGTCVTALMPAAACTRLNDSDACDLIGKGLVCTNGSCQSLRLARQGETCGALADGSFVLCTENAHCTLNDSGVRGTCDAPLREGAACDEAAGRKCADPAKCVSGTCRIRDVSVCK